MERWPAGWMSSFLRSFAIQGSWNYRSMIGSGFAFAMIPFLRSTEVTRDEFAAALGRHLDTFNSHPYLAGVALGAVARMEAEGEDPATIQRFKQAIQGSLGGLGDTLIWGAWRPVTLLLALAVAGTGVPVWMPVLLFLLLYNVGHVLLRAWGFTIGLEAGREVAGRFRAARLLSWAERLFVVGSVLVGLLAGGLLAGRVAPSGNAWLWSSAAVVSFVIGLRLGRKVLRLGTLVLVLTISIVTAVGAI